MTAKLQLLLTVEEAAEALKISTRKGYLMVQRGELPSVRVGTLVRIPAADLEAWVRKHTRREVDREE